MSMDIRFEGISKVWRDGTRALADIDLHPQKLVGVRDPLGDLYLADA